MTKKFKFSNVVLKKRQWVSILSLSTLIIFLTLIFNGNKRTDFRTKGDEGPVPGRFTKERVIFDLDRFHAWKSDSGFDPNNAYLVAVNSSYDSYRYQCPDERGWYGNEIKDDQPPFEYALKQSSVALGTKLTTDNYVIRETSLDDPVDPFHFVFDTEIEYPIKLRQRQDGGLETFIPKGKYPYITVELELSRPAYKFENDSDAAEAVALEPISPYGGDILAFPFWGNWDIQRYHVPDDDSIYEEDYILCFKPNPTFEGNN
jgi:hypothetical protein